MKVDSHRLVGSLLRTRTVFLCSVTFSVAAFLALDPSAGDAAGALPGSAPTLSGFGMTWTESTHQAREVLARLHGVAGALSAVEGSMATVKDGGVAGQITSGSDAPPAQANDGSVTRRPRKPSWRPESAESASFWSMAVDQSVLAKVGAGRIGEELRRRSDEAAYQASLQAVLLGGARALLGGPFPPGSALVLNRAQKRRCMSDC